MGKVNDCNGKGRFMARWRQWQAKWDWGYVVVLAIALVAVWPFLSRSALPQETDAELHVFRLAELSRLLRGGEWYPRWSPNFYYGYGYPIFNYYAPLTYYLGVVVEFMPGLGAVDGVKAIFELGLLAAAIGMYGFVRDNWGREAGWVAAASYLYAPYILYTDPHARGVLAESFSFGLFPLALWALDRLRRHIREGKPAAAAWLASVAGVAAITLTHNLMAMTFLPILAFWLVVMLIYDWQQTPSPRSFFSLSLVPCLAFFLGVTLAAFFWLPVILEREAINLSTLIGQNDNFDFRTHFLSLKQLLGASPWLDWAESGAVFTFNLGIPQWVLGLAGLLVIGTQFRRRAWTDWFYVGGTAGLLFLMLPQSLALWQKIPLLPYLQFPWRLLGPTAGFLAILAGIATQFLLGQSRFGHVPEGEQSRKGSTLSACWNRREGGRLALVVTFITWPILFGLPLTQMPPWLEDFGETSPARVLVIELSGRWLGTTSTADFVPVTVQQLPAPIPAVADAIYFGWTVDRVNRATLPAGTMVQSETLRPLRYRYTITTQEPFLLRLFLFAFPGWEVKLDGQPVPIELGQPEGFITTSVPVGEHVVDVAFVNTPARSWAWGIAGLSLLSVGLMAFYLTQRAGIPSSTPPLVSVGMMDKPILGWTLAIFLLFVVVLEPRGWLHADSSPYKVTRADQAVQVDFGGQVALIGYDVDLAAAAPGKTLPLTLYWQAEQTMEIEYQVFVHLLRPDGSLVSGAQSDKLNPGDYPTSRWPLDRYIRDVHEITLPNDLPPGEYWLATGLWVQTEGWRLPILGTEGQPVGDHYRFQALTIEP